MSARCGWCLEPHETAACPRLAILRTLSEFGIVTPRATADEVNDAIADRMMRYRATKNGLLGYAAEQGWTYPTVILEIDPDYIAP